MLRTTMPYEFSQVHYSTRCRTTSMNLMPCAVAQAIPWNYGMLPQTWEVRFALTLSVDSLAAI